MPRLALVIGLLCALAAPARAGYDEGLAAYERGDYAAALREWRPLAERGDADAQYALGLMYVNGEGVPQDYAEAVRWYRLAADQGDAAAQFNLGLRYDNGEGVPHDDVEAARWYRRAAEQGIAAAQFNLGYMYRNGEGVPQDHTEAVKWYRRAAEQGVANAQLNLGLMYVNGEGVPRDDAEAVRWFRLAAEQGLADAQYNLGYMYSNGKGVPQDYAEAIKWYRLAAEQGYAGAMNNLGVMYEYGRGVPLDLVRAYAWYNLAAARVSEPPEREKAVRNRDDIAQRLSPQKLTRAQALARQMDSDLAAGRGPADTGTPAPPALPPDVSVVVIQRSLAKLGYDPGPADGRPGPKTRAAIRAFEADNGLPVTGAVSEELRDLLALAAYAQYILQHRPEEEREKKLELTSTGTGFVVTSDGHVLTNHHVVAECGEVRGQRPGAETQSAASVALDSDNDLALLRLPAAQQAVAAFREGSDVRPGDGVVAVGFPLHGLLASGINVTTGTVSALAGIRDDIRYLQITAPVQPGNSGGPLLDMSGNVVGVVVGKLDALAVAEVTGDIPQNVNFAIKDSVARAFLDANGIDYETAASKGGIDTLDAADVGERARRFTVLLECWK